MKKLLSFYVFIHLIIYYINNNFVHNIEELYFFIYISHRKKDMKF